MLDLRAGHAGASKADAAWPVDGADARNDGSWPDARALQPDSGAKVSCSDLAALASRGVLTPRHAKQVLFAPDRTSIVLRLAGTDAGSGDEVWAFHLPSGGASYLTSGAVDIEWIVDGSRVLVTRGTVDSSLESFALDGSSPVLLAQATCEHLTSPDGSRVLASVDCDDRSATLATHDTRTGAAKTLGRSARSSNDLRPNVVFSPNGRWVAYREPGPPQGGSLAYGGLIHIVDDNNESYALTSQPLAAYPHFASDEVLLFSTNVSGGAAPADVRAHILGSGDGSRVIAKGVDFQATFGYRVSPDGQWFLAALIPVNEFSSYALAAYNVRDGRDVALTGNLFPFWSTQVAWFSFAFAADNRHVVYLTGGRARHTAVVASSGGASTELSAGASFVIPPTGNLVALGEASSSPMRVRLTDLDTTQDVASTDASATPAQITFTPDGRSLVFVESATPSTPARLRHLSGRHAVTTDLATWNVSHLGLSSAPCCNEPGPGYPIDPTGCFTVVDSDIDGGTRLVLLPDSAD